MAGRRVLGSLRYLMQTSAGAVLDAVCPWSCHVCGRTRGRTADRGMLCEECSAAAEQEIHRPYCPRCGLNVPPFGLTESGCGRCPKQRQPYDGVIRVATYRGAFRDLFLRYKFGPHEELTDWFARRLAARIMQSEAYESFDALTPVPTSWRHRLRRRFYPVTTLSKRVAHRTRIPYAPLIHRVGGGPHQTGRPASLRLENVRRRFRLAPGCSVRGGHICLIDDVMTTGATVGECARLLRRAGADAVHVAVLARSPDEPEAVLRA